MKAKNTIVLTMLLSVFFACTDDTENNHQRLVGYLYFNVSENHNWAEGGSTRAEEPTAPILMQCNIEGAQPLYLHSKVTPTPAINTAESMPVTRGNRLTGAVFTNGSISSFGCYGLCNDDVFIDGIEISDASKSTQEGTVGSPSENVFWYVKDVDFDNTNWPNGSQADFYGYAPYFAANGSATDETNGLRVYKGTNNVPTIEYKVPTTVANQLDILTAKHSGVSKNQDVELVFDHVLSAIKFNIKNGKSSSSSATDKDKGSMIWNDGVNDYYVTIQSISIKNVYDQGTWTVGTDVYSQVAPTWTYSTSSTPENEFTISPTTSLKNQTAPVEVNADNSGNVFMMMPQTTPDGAKLEIVCQMDGKDNESLQSVVTLYASLANITWKPGYTYIYSLSLSDFEYVFTIHEDSSDSYDGTETDKDNGTFSATNSGKDAYKVEIRSYRTDVNSVSEPVRWKAYHSLDNGTTYNEGIPNEWAHLKDNNGSSTAEVNTDLHIGAIAASNDRKFDLVVDEYLLKKNMDLSLYNIDNETRIKRSTANCYIVAEPGIYRIPLIYGNAYFNGVENENAYVSTESQLAGTRLKNMKNYLNVNIISPYIKTDLENQSKVISSAQLVWEDVNGLISDIELVTGDYYGDKDNNKGDDRYLQFKVAPATMNYGNAVVAIKDASGVIAWSWHIWTTNPDLFTNRNTYSTTRDGVTYSFSGRNLGWVDKADTPVTLEEPRSLMIKLVQEESGEELLFSVTEDGIVFTPQHRNTMFQFGRKDPMAGATGNGASNNIQTYGKLLFSVQDAGASTVTINTVRIADAIKNPNIQYVRMSYPTLIPSLKSYLYYGPTGTGDSYKNLWNINNPFASSNSDQNCYGKSVYDPCPVGYRVPSSAAFANFGLGSWTLVDKTADDGYLYASFGGGQMMLPFVGYRDSDNNGEPVDFNQTTYYGLASASPSDLNEYQMVRLAWHEATHTRGFDDSHKGMRNRSTQIRAIKDPDSGIPERAADINIHSDETVEPMNSLSRGNSGNWND